ncbi:hypothetical protein EC844_112100 [Acinetobacter calcoaceticus]|uniref:Uncharacterized protein n=1 Tax=Acinetobacter calcoaceticus TaxID=471 RepID=A0A4R1XQV7_ACICA|nr:hypothetical protein EC844_112100 [Acinetobacter calcoaceticus]
MSEPVMRSGSFVEFWGCILGAGLLLTGVYYLVACRELRLLVETWYFMSAGLLTTISAVYVLRKRTMGLCLFVLVFLGAIIWSLKDPNGDLRALFSRLIFPTSLLTVLLFTLPRLRHLQLKSNFAIQAYGIAIVLTMVMLTTLHQLLLPQPLVRLGLNDWHLQPVERPFQQIDVTGSANDQHVNRFLSMYQVNINQVHRLKHVWLNPNRDLNICSFNSTDDHKLAMQVDGRIEMVWH